MSASSAMGGGQGGDGSIAAAAEHCRRTKRTGKWQKEKTKAEGGI